METLEQTNLLDNFEMIIQTLWEAYDCDDITLKMDILSNLDNYGEEGKEVRIKLIEEFEDEEEPEYDDIIEEMVMITSMGAVMEFID